MVGPSLDSSKTFVRSALGGLRSDLKSWCRRTVDNRPLSIAHAAADTDVGRMKLGPKIGRNAPCPCGNGRKFKHCHGGLLAGSRYPSQGLDVSDLKPEFVAKIQEMHAGIQRRKAWPQNHGAVLPSVHTTMPDGTRLASAGNTLWKVATEETWHGFIYDLLRTQLGIEWFQAELSKPEADRHILANWFTEVCARELDAEQHHFTSWRPDADTGATLAFRSVAYDAFCLMQAMSLTPKLLARLRHPEQFEGARYELWVAATLARAGFELELLNEDDRSTRHGELIATHKDTGTKFWVEAKRRTRQIDQVMNDPERQRADVQGLVADAVRKPASYPRIVFVDVNLPPAKGGITQATWVRQFRTSLNKLAMQPAYRGREDMAAFVMATNHPYHYTSHVTPDPRQHFIGTHFNMPALNPATLGADQPVIMGLMHSIAQHFAIPDQFLS